MAKMPNPDWGTYSYAVKSNNTPSTVVSVSGRDRWALEQLIKAGPRGCTPIDSPAPRWSGYVWNLRQMGISIETVTETHKGPFPGSHARYVLRSIVTPLGKPKEAA